MRKHVGHELMHSLTSSSRSRTTWNGAGPRRLIADYKDFCKSSDSRSWPCRSSKPWARTTLRTRCSTLSSIHMPWIHSTCAGSQDKLRSTAQRLNGRLRSTTASGASISDSRFSGTEHTEMKGRTARSHDGDPLPRPDPRHASQVHAQTLQQ